MYRRLNAKIIHLQITDFRLQRLRKLYVVSMRCSPAASWTHAAPPTGRWNNRDYRPARHRRIRVGCLAARASLSLATCHSHLPLNTWLGCGCAALELLRRRIEPWQLSPDGTMLPACSPSGIRPADPSPPLLLLWRAPLGTPREANAPRHGSRRVRPSCRR